MKVETAIVLDTNVLLGLYKRSPDVSAFILKVLEFEKYRIWLPNQVIKEFERNSDKEKKKQFNKYKNIPNSLVEDLNKFKSSFNNKINNYNGLGFSQFTEMCDEVNEQLINVGKTISSAMKDCGVLEQLNREILIKDLVNSFIKKLNHNQKGEPFTTEELINNIRLGEIRYKYKIPPGYMDDPNNNKDSTKTGISIFGDYFIWMQIIKYSTNNNKNIIFVTEEKKEDWFKDNYPCQELINEFQESTHQCIQIMHINEFIEKSSVSNQLIKGDDEHTLLNLLANEYFYMLLNQGLEDIIFNQFDLILEKGEIETSNASISDFSLDEHESIDCIEFVLIYDPELFSVKYNYHIIIKSCGSGKDNNYDGMPIKYTAHTELDFSFLRKVKTKDGIINLTNKNIVLENITDIELEIMAAPHITNMDFDDSCIFDERY